MSVLVEALTIVVRRITLDLAYPGGHEAWIARHQTYAAPARYVSVDDHLVGVSFFSDALEEELEHLVSVGLVVLDDDEFQNVAVVDQADGLGYPCTWLEWMRPPVDGDRAPLYSMVWLHGTDPGTLAVPDGWTPGRSDLIPQRLRDIPNMLLLAQLDEEDEWLDVSTGRLHRERRVPVDPDAPPGPIRMALTAWMKGQGLAFTRSYGNRLSAPFPLAQLDCTLHLEGLEEDDILLGTLELPVFMPEGHRKVIEGMGRGVKTHPMTGRVLINLNTRLERQTPPLHDEIMAQMFEYTTETVMEVVERWLIHMEVAAAFAAHAAARAAAADDDGEDDILLDDRRPVVRPTRAPRKSMVFAIMKASTAEEMKAILQWMTENDPNNRHVETAIQKLERLEEWEASKSGNAAIVTDQRRTETGAPDSEPSHVAPAPASFVYFLADEFGVEQCRWYDGPIAARDGYVADDLINGLLAGDDDAIAEVQRIHGRATAAGQGLDDIAAELNAVTDDLATLTWWGRFEALCADDSDFASGLRESWREMADDEDMDDSAAADRPISADELEGFVEFLAEYGV